MMKPNGKDPRKEIKPGPPRMQFTVDKSRDCTIPARGFDPPDAPI